MRVRKLGLTAAFECRDAECVGGCGKGVEPPPGLGVVPQEIGRVEAQGMRGRKLMLKFQVAA
eukprot:12428676-Karenia_brevis.AAC.1